MDLHSYSTGNPAFQVLPAGGTTCERCGLPWIRIDHAIRSTAGCIKCCQFQSPQDEIENGNRKELR